MEKVIFPKHKHQCNLTGLVKMLTGVINVIFKSNRNKILLNYNIWASIYLLNRYKKSRAGLGVVAHNCSLSTLGGRGRQITWGQEFNTSLTNIKNPCLYYKCKLSWVWWHIPVIPATREAEAEELLEPSRWRLPWAKIAPLHSSLGNKSETSFKKKKRVIIQNSHSTLKTQQ